MASRTITLTTDFGHRDSWVGQMKGAALAVAADVRLVDLCHEVAAHDVASGAYVLETGFEAFVPGTVHLVVVDPEVGTERRAIAVETERYFFVAPDNGVLSRALARERVVRAHLLAEQRFRGPRRSTTFDGRDVFAPAAAWIARGVPLEEFGPPAGALVRIARTPPRLAPGLAVPVAVLAVDRFGNVVLDLTADELAAVTGGGPDETSPLLLATPRGAVRRFRRTYSGAGGGPFLLINSAGYLEVALDRGRAADALGLEPGGEARLTIGRPDDVL